MPVATRLVSVTAAVVAAAGLMAAPASADVRSFSDPPAAPGVIDIRNVRVDNSTTHREKIIVNVRMRNIRFGDGMSVYVDTRPGNAGPEYRMDAFANSEFAFHRVNTWGGPGRVVRCDGDRFRLAAGARRARIVFPRACLGNPGRVRIAVHAYRDDRSDWARSARNWLGFVRR